MRVRSRLFHGCAALVLAVGGLACFAPAAHAVPTDDVGVAVAGTYPNFDVLANDDASPYDYVELDPGADPRAYSTGSHIAVNLDTRDTAPESIAIPYTVVSSDSGDPVGSAVLTVHVTSDRMRVESGDASATVRWPGLGAAVDGARISWSSQYLNSHESAQGTRTVTGGPPWTVEGLSNGGEYYLYVTPRVGAVEAESGLTDEASPRATNAPPVAHDDTVSVLGSDEVWFVPENNDTDADYDELEVVSHTQPQVGTVVCAVWGCSYDPGPAPTTGSFDYTVGDGHGGTDTTTVDLVVRNVTLADDTFTLPADEWVVFNPGHNDQGLLDGDWFDMTFDDPAVDWWDARGEIYVATPGTYTGTYTAYTEQGDDLGTANLTLTVGPRRDLVAYDDTDYTEMSAAVTVSVAQDDRIPAHGFPLDLTQTALTEPPAHGVAELTFEARYYLGEDDDDDDWVLRNLPVIKYTPDPGYLGKDTMTYTLVDSHGHRDQAELTVTVGASGVDPYTIDTGLSSASFALEEPGSPAIDEVLVCWTAATERRGPAPAPTRPCAHQVPTTGVPSSVELTGLTPDREHRLGVWSHYDDGSVQGLWVGPNTAYARPGVDSVDRVWVEVGADRVLMTWDNPTGSPGEVPSTGTTIGWSATAPPTEPGTGPGWTSLAQGVGTLEITGLSAGTSYDYGIFATAAHSWADPWEGSFTPAPGNVAPVVGNDTLTVDENESASVDVLANDTDDEPLSIREWSQPAHGSVSCASHGPTCTYTADEGYAGTDSFTYTVSDGRFGIVTGTVAVTVTPIPDPPIAYDHAFTVTQNVAAQIDLAHFASDPDGDALTFAVTSQPGLGAITCAGATGACSYTATSSGTDSFVFTVTDATGRTDTGRITITVVPNQDPTAREGSATVEQGASRSIDLNDFAEDPDGDALTFAVISPVAKGTLTCTALGACTYVAGEEAQGTDSFVYQVTDAKGATAVSSVEITIRRRNRAPVAGNDSATTAEGVAVLIDVSNGDSDPDSDLLTYAVATGPGHGTVACTAAGGCTYTPATGWSGTDTFTYTVSDGRLSATGTVTVTVAQAAPVIVVRNGPKVSGKAKVGKTLKVVAGHTSPTGVKVTFAWLRDGKAIKKATKATYKLTKPDKGKRISVRVTYRLAGASTVVKVVKVPRKVT